ncbi:uncharacterized protein LOC124266736 [Haliotis rubra]|uniref:uncharacterized protein LOC124266736 n=1 Tax=Haliotis rubra TaxID=36100 RepID=UPI001EE5DD21|nr:uncharacterized protein LOC124266736 [Haliotis rubra]
MSTLPVTLSCLLLLVVAASSTKPALDRAKKTSDPNQWRNRPQSPCNYGGRAYNSGAVFLAQNRCSKIRCTAGQMRFVDIKCLYNNMCYNVGANIRGGHNGCQLMNCQGNGQFRPVLSDPYRCKDARNMCRMCQG